MGNERLTRLHNKIKCVTNRTISNVSFKTQVPALLLNTAGGKDNGSNLNGGSATVSLCLFSPPLPLLSVASRSGAIKL